MRKGGCAIGTFSNIKMRQGNGVQKFQKSYDDSCLSSSIKRKYKCMYLDAISVLSLITNYSICHLKVQCHVHKNSPLILVQLDPVHYFDFYFC